MKASQNTQKSLNEYWLNITNGTLTIDHVIDLLLARIAAFSNLANKELKNASQAKSFLLKTMSISESDYHFPKKIEEISNISRWHEPEILCFRQDKELIAVVYKIKMETSDHQLSELHEISFFEETKHGLRYTHKYNLKLSPTEQAAIFATDLPIRQIGDPVLAATAKRFDFEKDDPAELTKQIEILQQNLYRSGGVGIAANQITSIENPFSVFLGGGDYDNKQHVKNALFRYPTTLFLKMKKFINPKIVDQSKNLIAFAEGCLSVKSPIRALVLRPDAITLEYQDLSGTTHRQFFSGDDARVILHESDHILKGKVYIERIIEELSVDQLTQLIQILKNSSTASTQKTFAPTRLFTRDGNNKIIFDPAVAQSLFEQLADNTKQGLYQALTSRLEFLKKPTGFFKKHAQSEKDKHPDLKPNISLKSNL